MIEDNGGYGIVVSNASINKVIILGNQLRNNSSGAISDSGTGTEVAHNIQS